ncbi:3-isopropylmalate dehydratase small subunit 1 [Vibrio quintilis]|uniref:3-isopropylmalate dehydratase small subunit 1 n=3 Tax=Vibrio quintilis TaxID=1117707 RepID=A0A1M7YQK8_9VIBR|nr:3-isopropylmalate dehydratase small subunit 1 [Vibrio quintilis]
MVPVRLTEAEVDEIFRFVEANEGAQVTVNLETMKVSANGKEYSFEIDEFRRHCLLNGLDNIGLTLQHEDKIAEYEGKIPAFLG